MSFHAREGVGLREGLERALGRGREWVRGRFVGWEGGRAARGPGWCHGWGSAVVVDV